MLPHLGSWGESTSFQHLLPLTKGVKLAFTFSSGRFSPDSVKMALIRAFVKQVTNHHVNHINHVNHIMIPYYLKQVRHHIIMERYHNKQVR